MQLDRHNYKNNLLINWKKYNKVIKKYSKMFISSKVL